MFTKEDLLAMKYKELVVIAKQYGVYKSRIKKVNLLNKLLSIPFNQVVDDQDTSAKDKSDTDLIDTTQKTDSFENMLCASPAPLRRETFEVVPRTEDRDSKRVKNDFSNIDGGTMDINVSSIRRETFNIDKGSRKSSIKDKVQITNDKETLSSARSGISRQNTFSIDKPKEILADKTEVPATPIRQNTFSIDKPNKNNKVEEMPGIISKDFKSTPIKPYILNGAATSSPVRTRNSFRSIGSAKSIGQRIENRKKQSIFEEMPGSVGKEFKSTPVKPYNLKEGAISSPVRTRNSIHRSIGSAKSIGQRIENQRSAKIERRPSSRGSKIQKNFSVSMVSVTPTRVHKTSVKAGRIEKKITPSKLPNFKAIHLREFSKMESIVEHTKRKEERTKALLTPLKLNPNGGTKACGASLVTSRIPVKLDLSTTVVEPKPSSFTRGNQSMTTHSLKNATLQKNCVSNITDKLQFINSPMSRVKRKSANSGATEDIKNKIAPNPKKRVENVKEIVTSKMHPFSVERNRAKGRDFLKSVRMNKRFQLQMEVMRKAKA